MKKIPKQAYTTEFKELAVQRVTDGLTASERRPRSWGWSSRRCATGSRQPRQASSMGRRIRWSAGTDGAFAAAGRERAAEDGERDFKKSDGVLREGRAVKYAWIDGTYSVPAGRRCADTRGERQRLSGLERAGKPESHAADRCAVAGDPGHPRRAQGRLWIARACQRSCASAAFRRASRVERLMRENGIRARHKRR